MMSEIRSKNIEIDPYYKYYNLEKYPKIVARFYLIT